MSKHASQHISMRPLNVLYSADPGVGRPPGYGVVGYRSPGSAWRRRPSQQPGWRAGPRDCARSSCPGVTQRDAGVVAWTFWG